LPSFRPSQEDHLITLHNSIQIVTEGEAIYFFGNKQLDICVDIVVEVLIGNPVQLDDVPYQTKGHPQVTAYADAKFDRHVYLGRESAKRTFEFNSKLILLSTSLPTSCVVIHTGNLYSEDFLIANELKTITVC
jgi:hypothetical protein